MKNSLKLYTVLLVFLILSQQASAWGRRGHQMVAENAAMLVSSQPNAEFMRAHSFDLGYYANVPDFVWKKPATYAQERPEHYINLEVYNRAFARHKDAKADDWKLSRKEFEARFPEVNKEAGRAFFRIREMDESLKAVSDALYQLKEPKGQARQKLQEKWMVIAGTMAHYVGDLGMPLHVTENHDGLLTSQKGIHGYFEDVMVDQLYPELDAEVHQEAMKRWPTFHKKNANKSTLELVQAIAEHSVVASTQLLKIDKNSNRKDIKKNVQAYHAMIRERLVDSVLALAEMYSRRVGFPFDDNKFYFFAGEPAYIVPGEVSAQKTGESK